MLQGAGDRHLPFVLELIKMGHIHVVQEEIFDDIQIDVVTDPETWKNLTEFAEEG